MNQETKPRLIFAHVSDSHVGSTPDFTLRGRCSLPLFERLIETLNALPYSLDFIVHTGDISNDHSPASYELAASALAKLNAPMYYVNGNHDDAAMLHKHLHALGTPPGLNGARLAYAFEVKGERFVVLDTVGPDDPIGHLDATQLDLLRAECAGGGPPLTVFMHHPPFKVNSPWADANMPLDNGDEVHAALLPARERLRGVFCGHMHRSSQFVSDGITYVVAGSSHSQIAWLPDQRFYSDKDALPTFNLVQYFEHYVLVSQYTFTY
jgi:Icc protein